MKLLTIKEISERLNKNPHTIRRWIKAGLFGKSLKRNERHEFIVTEQQLEKFMSS